MLFNTYLFWAFFGIVAVAYWRLPHRAQNVLLLAASYVFYAAWDWRFLPLLFASTAINYAAGRFLSLEAPGAGPRKAVVALAVVANLAILAAFKYAAFLTDQFNLFADVSGLLPRLPVPHILLPIGISFFTFQGMAYVIDVYRNRLVSAKGPGEFALFICFFPQLVAGPIERASRLIAQIRQARSWRAGVFTEGFHHVCLGLFKKSVIADNMAAIVNAIFSSPLDTLSAGEVVVGVYAFAFQIYGDFSGYSSIARGVARWLGFDLSENFNAPYFSASLREFWQRWHISLSQWLRDYVYIPFGGNRCGQPKTYRNILVTMALGGLWHGANWTFVAWGVYHGALQCIERGMQRLGFRFPAIANAAEQTALRPLKVLIVFHCVCLGWLFFRAESFSRAFGMLCRIFVDMRLPATAVGCLWLIFFYCAPLLLLEALGGHRNTRARIAAGAFYVYAAAMLLFFPSPTQHEFIYFQF